MSENAVSPAFPVYRLNYSIFTSRVRSEPAGEFWGSTEVAFNFGRGPYVMRTLGPMVKADRGISAIRFKLNSNQWHIIVLEVMDTDRDRYYFTKLPCDIGGTQSGLLRILSQFLSGGDTAIPKEWRYTETTYKGGLRILNELNTGTLDFTTEVQSAPLPPDVLSAMEKELKNSNVYEDLQTDANHFTALGDSSARKKEFLSITAGFVKNPVKTTVYVRRGHVFNDSFEGLMRGPFEQSLGDILCAVKTVFVGENGVDAGGILREWYSEICEEVLSPHVGILDPLESSPRTLRFKRIPVPTQRDLDRCRFLGRVAGRALIDDERLLIILPQSICSRILGKELDWHMLKEEDPDFYRSATLLLDFDADMLADLDLNFVYSDGADVTDLVDGGSAISVTTDNCREYVEKLCLFHMIGRVQLQTEHFCIGVQECFPRSLLPFFFTTSELIIALAGAPDFDVTVLKENTTFPANDYTESSDQVIWLWRALQTYTPAQRCGFLEFVTGSGQPPIHWAWDFKVKIGRVGLSNPPQLPCSHTCGRTLDLPAYSTYDQLCQMLTTAIAYGRRGFAFD